MSKAIRGSCLCGGVRFEADPPFIRANHVFGGDWPEGPQVSIRLGTFDDDPGIAPQFHTFVDSRAPWDEISDDLPRYRGGWSRDAVPDRDLWAGHAPCGSAATHSISTRAFSASCTPPTVIRAGGESGKKGA